VVVLVTELSAQANDSQTINPMKKYTYYRLTAVIDGKTEVIAGSFDKSDLTYELEMERDSLREEGYRKFAITSEKTTEQPDVSIYGQQFVASL